MNTTPAIQNSNRILTAPARPSTARLTLLLAGPALLFSSCMPMMATGTAAKTYSLNFADQTYSSGTTTVNGQAVAYRAYENVVYVQHPEDAAYESMNIYVPEAYFQGQPVGTYTAQTAPIFLPNQIGGYSPALPGTLEAGGLGGMGLAAGGVAPTVTGTASPAATPAATTPAATAPAADAAPAGAPAASTPNAAQMSLARGYIVASPGARGRSSKNAAGEYIGKAPAAIVDLKAAVAYLRANDAVMPGNAERIISNGTSAGGGLSALLGATGNNPDYAPYLKALGAAPARNDIYAVSAYAAITDLDHADTAYEWLFNGVNTYTSMNITVNNGVVTRTQVPGTLTDAQINVSNDLKAMFPGYLNSLALKTGDTALTLDAQGNGPFKTYVASLVQASAQRALDAGTDLSQVSYLTIQNGKVTGVDFDAYVKAAGRQKTPPAFDGLSLENPENEEFGTRTVNTRHFTDYSQQHTAVSATQAEALTVKMMNPMYYIGDVQTKPAAHWRIRQGTADRDTALAVPVILGTKLSNLGYDVDLALPWNQGHGGDYDLDQLFTWMDKVVAQ